MSNNFMPLTPFLGLSVLIHICIIVGYKLFSRSPKKKPVKAKNVRLTRAIGVTTIFLVFIFVVTNATILVRASLVDKHSSVKFVSHAASSAIATVRGVHTGAAIKTADTKKIIPKAPVSEVSESVVVSDCVVSPFDQDLNYKLSLVDYLKMKNRESSFEARHKIAEAMGVEDYRGSLEDNQIILGWFLSIAKNCKKNVPPLAND